MISGGTISVEDAKKHDGYPDPQFAPTRKVRVELIFASEDDAESEMDRVSALANDRVEQLLNKKPLSVAPEVKPKPEKPVKPGKGKTKADLESEQLEELNKPKPKKIEAAQTTSEDDDLLSGGATAPEPISDKQLLDAVKAVNVNEKMAPRIKEVIFSFCPREDKAGFRVADIAQEHRATFIEKLKLLPTT